MGIPFETDDLDLYEILGVASGKSATPAEIKRAYRLKALKFHPDKAKDDAEKEEFHQKFQIIVFAYGVLTDEKRRSRYDRTGSLDDGLGDDDKSLSELFSELYDAGISKDMVEQDRKEYQGSQEEVDDIMNTFEQSNGDLDVVFESVPHSVVPDDEDRFIEVIKANADKASESYKHFKKHSLSAAAKKSRRANARKEAKEAEKMAAELGIDKADTATEDSLALLIQKRQKGRMDILDSIADKYTNARVTKGKKKSKAKK